MYGNCYCGFNPGVSNALMGLQMFTAGMNGISNGIQARNNGATPQQAAFCGMSTAFTGAGNAILGNAINQGTHTYWGTAMSSFAPGVNNFANPFMGNPFMNPFMMNTFCSPFSFGCGWYC